ncbi:MAG: hypothetical protein FWB83_02815 [Treponema sp.]|nr:hypothetical protein [Treponema sp.]
MRNFIIVFVIAVIFTGAVFAQDEFFDEPEAEPRALNRLGLSIGLMGADFTYERVFNQHFSVLGQVSYNNWVIADSLAISGKARVYPFGGVFFLDLGIGYSNGYNITEELTEIMLDIILGIVTFGLWFLSDEYKEKSYLDDVERGNGILIQPSLGWNIDVGRQDRFFMPINMGLDIRVGSDLTVLPFFRMGVSYSF